MKILAAMVFFLTSLFAGAADVSFKGVKPAVIIDVRTPQEYAAGHVEGALNIPHDRIAEGIGTVKRLKKDQPVLVYCRSGRRSALARQALEKEGYRNVLDGGGIETVARELKVCAGQTC